MCNWGLVDPPSRVDVDRVDYLVSRPMTLVLSGVGDRILPSWSKQKTSILRERQPPEERGEGLVGIDVRILNSQSVSWFGRRFHGHHGRERHGRSW